MAEESTPIRRGEDEEEGVDERQENGEGEKRAGAQNQDSDEEQGEGEGERQQSGNQDDGDDDAGQGDGEDEEEEEEDDDDAAESSESDEFLAKTRARRSKAGALMASLVNDEADDELALLFAEQDDDEEFEEPEEEEPAAERGQQRAGVQDKAGVAVEGGERRGAADDMEIESSSADEEDKGADADQDDYSGEEQLQKQERQAKKRKKQDHMKLPALRKRVKIDAGDEPARRGAGGAAGPRTPTIPPPRPRKKSERISWLPPVEDGPVRSSSRKQTMQNKELTHARLKDNAVKRERQIRTMRQAAEQKAKDRPRQLTQADRLANAVKTERSNTKSLNRWEEMEKKKAEEQRAKLEALQNRQLEGPVVTWWSGVARWVNERLAQVGQKTFTQPGKADSGGYRRKKLKEGANGDKPTESESKDLRHQPGDAQPMDVQLVDTRLGSHQADGANAESSKEQQPEIQQLDAQTEDRHAPHPPERTTTEVQENSTAAEDLPQGDKTEDVLPTTTTPDAGQPSPSQPPVSKPTSEPMANSSFLLDGIQLYASMDQGAEPTPAIAPAAPAVADVDRISQAQAQLPPPHTEVPPQTDNHSPNQHQNLEQPHEPNYLTPQPEVTPPQAFPQKTELSSRNCMVLEHFDELPAPERGDYSIFFNPRKPQKLQKIHQDICPITSLPARYRDPQTGLAYANSLAYREIRQLLLNRYAWSGMLGCFVGPVGVGARGVPDRFLLPNVVPPAPPQLPLGAGAGAGADATPVATPTPGDPSSRGNAADVQGAASG